MNLTAVLLFDHPYFPSFARRGLRSSAFFVRGKSSAFFVRGRGGFFPTY
jgi:hypothetical protein